MSKRHLGFFGVILLLFVGGGVFYIPFLTKPTVSVVMPVYNRSELVGRAIESVLNQTFTDFEFIIVDDGSTDATPDVVRSYAEKDKRIRFLSYGTNRGVSAARQYGLDAARGRFVAIMDSDDISLPDRLAATVRFLNEHSEFVAVSGQVKLFTDETPVSDIKKSLQNETPVNSLTIRRSGHEHGLGLIFSNSFQNTTALFRRAFVQNNGIRYNPLLENAEDYDFWASFVIRGGLLAEVNEILGYVRKHSTYAPEYYDTMHENSKKVVRRLISRFYTPTEEETAYGNVNLLKQCRILKKILKTNKTQKIIPASDMLIAYHKRCPANVNRAVALYHPFWLGVFGYETKTQGTLWPMKSTARFKKTKKYLRIEWDKWAPELFRLAKEGETGYFVPAEEQIQIVHPQWTETLVYESGRSILCRTQTNDCAAVTAETDTRLTLSWENKKWGTETFKKDGDVWRFVPMPSKVSDDVNATAQ